MKCLLVDDEPGIREGLAALLRRKGHDVRTAADCDAARAALAVERFDVVVTDWRLPDGLAATFLGQCEAPVLAVSGHPEEVTPAPAIRAVLTKPCLPSQLLAAIASVTVASPAAQNGVAASLPADTQTVIDEFVAQLPNGCAAEAVDDGTFVTVCAELPIATARALQVRGGDLRSVRAGDSVRVELRLCRDGRPDLHVPVLPAGVEWPARSEFAVDFHQRTMTPAEFRQLLVRRAGARAAGATVHFLNVPAQLSSHGTAHDMPMSGPVGPRLQPEHQDLWSQP